MLGDNTLDEAQKRENVSYKHSEIDAPEDFLVENRLSQEVTPGRYVHLSRHRGRG